MNEDFSNCGIPVSTGIHGSLRAEASFIFSLWTQLGEHKQSAVQRNAPDGDEAHLGFSLPAGSALLLQAAFLHNG